MHRYYHPDFQQPCLSPDEAHHCTHVLRQKPGDRLTVFDGRGTSAECRIEEVTAGTVRLRILQQSTTLPLPGRLTLAAAIPKKNMDWIVQKATELGVATIVPLLSERTIVPPGRDLSAKTERWRAISLDACKQSGNNWLPDLQPPRPVTEFLTTLGPFDLALIASLQPDARSLKQILRETFPAPVTGPPPACSVLVLIGPEGDFTAAEIAAAVAHGCQPLSLGPLVLRAETAALYALSILRHELLAR